MIDKLTNSHQGEFLVHTASGTVYLVELVGDKQGGFITRSPEKEDNLRSMRKDNSKPVSYTHLTLPTKRIV